VSLYNLHVVAQERHCSVLALLIPERPPTEMTVAEMTYLQAFDRVQSRKANS